MNDRQALRAPHDPMKDDFDTQLRLSRTFHRGAMRPAAALFVVAVLTLAAAFVSPLIPRLVLSLYGTAALVAGVELMEKAHERVRDFINDHSLYEQGDHIVVRKISIEDLP